MKEYGDTELPTGSPVASLVPRSFPHMFRKGNMPAQR